MDQLTLHLDAFWISPYSFSAFVALEEKKLPYTIHTVDLARGDQRAPQFLHQSLTGRVPCLQHGDYWLSESSAIAEYLAETFPFPDHPRLFPADLRERGRCRQIQAWVRSDLLPIREERPTSTMFYERATRALSADGERAAASLLRVAAEVIPVGRDTLFAEWCIADADLGFVLQRLLINNHPLPAKVQAYCEAQWRRPSVKKFVERERQPYLAY